MTLHTWGQGNREVFLLHCSLARAKAWSGLSRLMPTDMRLTAPDLLGHGDAPDPDPDRDYHDQLLEAALDQLPPGRCDLIGHSLGATVALRMALDHPERFRSLTMIEPVLICVAKGAGRAAHDTDAAPMVEALAQGQSTEATRIFLKIWSGEDLNALPDPQKRYVTDRIWVVPATDATLLQDRAGLVSRLSELRVPTLLLRGSRSHPVTEEINNVLGEVIPKAMSDVVVGANHTAPITHPKETAEFVVPFLDQNPAV